MNIVDKNEITEIYNRIKSDAAPIFSNYFFQPLSEKVRAIASKNSLIFLNPDDDFCRFYFITTDFSDLENLMEKSYNPDCEVCADLVYKNTLLPEIEAFYKKHFTFYAKFRKMTLTRLPENINPQVHKSDISASSLRADILKTFDKYTSYFPSPETFTNAIEKNWLVSIGNDSDIKGYIMFEIKGKQAYLNFIANRGGKENLLKLWKNFYETIAAFGAKSVFLWVDENNTKALRMYDIEGFKNDSVYNYICK